ncbi:MAG: putative glycosyltransferase EpsJ [Alphaproteobacteria bacterium ADurb.Bin438]|nr:MAG: putative glycosyltransferase EpsJ [Alphaproteobacteria bacterium ADurb.Bin438]
MNNKEINVVIPVYNVEKYLSDCLNSLINQTYPYWRAILVNDGSKDKSYDIMMEFQAKDNRFICLTGENQGASEARNKGLEKVDGDYLFFLDSDDFIHPQTFEIMVAKLEESNADFVSFKATDVAEDACLSGFENFDKNQISGQLLKKPFESFMLDKSVASPVVWNKMYRFDKIKGAKFFKELRYEDDYTFLLQALNKMESHLKLDINLYFLRSNPNSLTRKVNYETYVKSALARMSVCKNHLIDKGLYSKANQEMLEANMANDFVRMLIRKILRKAKDKNLAEVIRIELIKFIKDGTIKTKYLNIYKRICVYLFTKKLFGLVKILISLT